MKTNIRSILYICIMILFVVPAFGGGRTEDTNGERMYSSYNALKKLIDEGGSEYYLLDVRTAGEYESGHIPTAYNVPVDSIPEAVPEVYKDKLIIVYCRSGARSSRAKSMLEEAGFSRVYDFGGISKWEAETVSSEPVSLPPVPKI